MDSKDAALTERQEYWLKHIQACEASGKGATAYAAEQGFRVGAMYAGKKTLMRKGILPSAKQSRFQRVQTATSDTQWRFSLPNGVSVELSGSIDGGSLAAVLRAAARLE